MTLKISTRSQKVPTFMALKLMADAKALAATGVDVVSLAPGQPSKGAPACVLEKMKSIMVTEPQGYTEACGLPALRQSIAAFYQSRYGLSIAPERVIVTTGSSGAFMLSFIAAFDAGDKVALAAPCYPAYRNILRALDLVPVEFAATHETHFQPTVEMLEALPEKPAGLIIASPSNPAGTLLDAAELKKISDYCKAKGIRLISDEIYHGVTYETNATSALSFTDEAVVINSFSKYFALTGWRLGWMIAPTDMVDKLTALAQNLYISPPTISQHAGIVTLQSSEALAELDGYVADYRKNRDLLLRELPALGFTELSQAAGGFYIYANLSKLCPDSRDYSAGLLKNHHLAVTPGLDFDLVRGHQTVRLAFAGSYEDMEKALVRMAAYHKTL